MCRQTMKSPYNWNNCENRRLRGKIQGYMLIVMSQYKICKYEKTQCRLNFSNKNRKSWLLSNTYFKVNILLRVK